MIMGEGSETITIPKELAEEAEEAKALFGFKKKDEFVSNVLREKLLEIRKRRFEVVTEDIKKTADILDISEEGIIEDFHIWREKQQRR